MLGSSAGASIDEDNESIAEPASGSHQYNNLQQPIYTPATEANINGYYHKGNSTDRYPPLLRPQRLSNPPQPPKHTQTPVPSMADPYSAAFSLLQGARSGAGSFYPEATPSHDPARSSTKSPDIVSPRPQRLTPSIPSTLAQSLDQKSWDSSPAVPAPAQELPQKTSSMGTSQSQLDGPPQLPQLDISGRRPSEGSLLSSQYSIPSGVEEYLKSDSVPQPANQPPQPQAIRQEPSRGVPAPSKNDPYSTSQPSRNDPYSSYNASAYPPPQPSFADEANAPSHSNSGPGKYPQPPAMVDYSQDGIPVEPYSRGRQPSYPQQQEPYPPAAQQPQRGRSPNPRPYSRDYSGGTPPRQSTPRPNRASAGYSQNPINPEYSSSSRPASQEYADPSLQAHRLSTSVPTQRATPPDFIDMPEPYFAQEFNELGREQRFSPPLRATENPPRSSPRLQPTPGAGGLSAVTPLAVVPKSDYEWESEIESEREQAKRTNDANVALSWAEKVYMYVSISLEELMRDQQDNITAGRPATPDFERGLREDCKWVVEKFVRAKNPKAIYMRGIWFDYGDFGYPNDRHEAYHAYTVAAKQGYFRAEYRLGKMYEDVSDMKRAMHHYERGVQQGDSACLYRLGMMKLFGQKGTQVNIPDAVRYLNQSAMKADLDAPQGAYVFALLLAGEFTDVNIPESTLPRDERGALRLLEKSASLGFSHAQQKLGYAYENGLWGCGYDPLLSLHYYQLAAKQGDVEALMGLSKWYLCGADEIARNEEKAFLNAEKAAKLGHPPAEFAMGYYYEVGIYVRSDLMRAETWYAKAAEHGNKDAIARREGISRNKTLSRKDHETITANIRQNRLKKGQKATSQQQQARPPQQAQPQPPRRKPVSPTHEQLPELQRPYTQDSAGRSQSPSGRQSRIPSGPQQQPQRPVHPRTYSGNGAPPPPPEQHRHSSYGSYNVPEQYGPDARNSSYGSIVPHSASQPALSSNYSTDPGYGYSPPVRPATGGPRPVSQESLGQSQSRYQWDRQQTSDVFGTGPKTFQEMGISNPKKEECRIM